MAKSNLYRTALIVTAFSVIERFLGFLYRIILSRTLGSEGLGLYSVALSVFAVFVTVTASGIPITVSRIMTKHRANGNFEAQHATISAGIICVLVFALPICLIFYLGSSFFDFIFTDKRCMSILLYMLPGLIFTSVYSVLRGSFWGNKDFMPYSVIELIEELTMIAVGTALVIGSTDVFSGAKRAGLAILISYVLSFSLSIIYFTAKGGKLKKPKGQFKPLLASALPITGMRTASSIVNSLIAILLPMRLIASGLSDVAAMSEFGIAFGMSMPVLFVPSTIIGSIALVLTPELSESFYKRQHLRLKRNVETALSLTVGTAFIIIPVFLVLGGDVGMLLYANLKSGQIIQRCAFILLPASLTMITNSILNSLGYERQTLVFYLIGAAAMLLCVWFLPKICGVYALGIGFAISYTANGIFNLITISKKCREKIEYSRVFIVCLITALVTTIIGALLRRLLTFCMNAVLGLIVTAAVMVAVTFALYALFGIFKPKAVKKLFFDK